MGGGVEILGRGRWGKEEKRQIEGEGETKRERGVEIRVRGEERYRGWGGGKEERRQIEREGGGDMGAGRVRWGKEEKRGRD